MLFDLLLVSTAVLLNGRTVMAQRAGTPCQSVSSMSSAFMSMYPTATAALVPAKAAEDCLKSVPVDKAEDLKLIEEMKLYINWQSNLAYLLDPPEGYTEERMDTMDEIARITKDLEDDKYKDEYTLMFDLSSVLTKSYDFHFAFAADITQVFRFRRGNIARGLLDEFALVSVSKDGKEHPKLYNYYDIIVGQEEGWQPSVVTQVNNQSAEEYLQNWSTNFVYHEDHARYNRLFPNQAQISMGQRINQFGRSFIPDGDYTTVTHENGTVRQYINNAIVQLDTFDGVEDGDSFYERFCNVGPPQSTRKRGEKVDLRQHALDSVKRRGTPVKRQTTASSEATATGFPEPHILHSEGIIGGYYLSGNGYEDVAVLSVPSFSPEEARGPLEFQELTKQFLEDAVKDGKKKLVIDLRGNGGGRVFLGYDLFKQLFPGEDPYGASQFRANDAFKGVGKTLMDQLKIEGVTYDVALADFNKKGPNSQLAVLWQSIFNWQLPLTTENKNFTSWDQYFGPNERHNDKFTTVHRKDLNNPFSDDLTLDVTGYGTRQSDLNTKQPFEAANIVLLQDGGCGSTCAVFSEFMKSQGGVQQIVFGGKPEDGTMQGVAGSKGSQVWTWTQVMAEAARVYENLPEQQEEFNKTEVGSLYFADRPLMRSAYRADGMTQSVINLRDNIRMNDTTVTPLEFVYEAADCRIFYTADMVRDVEVVWRKAADFRFGNNGKDLCVKDSYGHESALSGGAKPQEGNGNVAAPGKKKGAASSTRGGSAALAAVVGVAAVLFMM